MPCGHGGLCFSCAIDIWRNSNCCYLCRADVREIVQILLPHQKSPYLSIACPEESEKQQFFDIVASTRNVGDLKEIDLDLRNEIEFVR